MATEDEMPQAITDEQFGAWVLKCNPRTWDLEGFLADGEGHIDSWSVQDNYRSARMRPGDAVVLWVTGSASANLIPGVWGVGYVTAPMNVEVSEDDDTRPTDDRQPQADDEAVAGYWLDLGALNRARYFVEVDLPLLDEPVSRARIQATPALAEMELLRQPQMSNPSWLTKDEWGALQQLLGEFALEPADPVAVGEWKRAADTQQPDPFTRLVIETIAVRHVLEVLGAEGWNVDDVQRDKVGWDLTARRAGRVRHIEVKGRGPVQQVVQLTSNEVRAAREQAGWELAVVTGALTAPKLSWYTAEAVVAVAVPITYRAVLG
jgi:hypothetical protein